MIIVTVNMPSAAEDCRKLSGNCEGISHCLQVTAIDTADLVTILVSLFNLYFICFLSFDDE